MDLLDIIKYTIYACKKVSWDQRSSLRLMIIQKDISRTENAFLLNNTKYLIDNIFLFIQA